MVTRRKMSTSARDDDSTSERRGRRSRSRGGGDKLDAPEQKREKSATRSRAGSASSNKSGSSRSKPKDDKRSNRDTKKGGSKPTGKRKKASNDTSIKVAVRVRPFLDREKGRTKVIVDMDGNQTFLKGPKSSNKSTFAYDHSYWSHDGFKEEGGVNVPDPSHPNGAKYASQQKVFDDLGEDVMANAWEGYNSTLFAYGQTGSGKSYSVIGYQANKGIVPVFCERLFEEINSEGQTGFEVTFSMMEIYNEVVQDLLNPSGDKKHGLKIREHSTNGFYAQGLTTLHVKSQKQIEAKMDEGTKNRTVASTKMNDTSSRAHTIVSITFIQKGSTTRSSTTHLVDLAGSERMDRTGSTGDRLKEGASINLSLTSLGKCIAALADGESGKKAKVPYRDSVLTKLLMNALGGNSKTVMIAAISPSDIDHDETLSTLRYADRAKKIKTQAKINESETDKMIRDLQGEIARLMGMLENNQVNNEDMVAEIAEDNKQMLLMAGNLDQVEDVGKENDKQVKEMMIKLCDRTGFVMELPN